MTDMVDDDGEDSDFVRWEAGIKCSLGRPMSRLVSMTAGLDRLVSAIRGGQSGGTGTSHANVFDDDSGFIILPSGAGRFADPVVLGGRYRLVRLLGTGTFAQTVEAEDELSAQQPRARVAIKIIRSGLAGIGEREAELLHLLKHSPGFSGANVVRVHSTFHVNCHECIAMELLAQPLPHYLRSVRPFSLPMEVMQKLSMQLLVALSFLSVNGVIHADIRPENVLVCLDRVPDSVGINVKLADFGNGMLEGQAVFECEGVEVQTLPYRAPEVLLGLSISAKIDMWSLGCLILEVFMGRRLLNPYSPTSALSIMTRILGPLPDAMLSGERGKPFRRTATQPSSSSTTTTSSSSSYTCMEQQGLAATLLLRAKVSAMLERGGEASNEEWGPGLAGRRQMAGLVAGLLAYDPAERLSPLDALRHPFVEALSPVSFLWPRHTLQQPHSSQGSGHDSGASPAAHMVKNEQLSPNQRPPRHGKIKQTNKGAVEQALVPERAPYSSNSSRSPSMHRDVAVKSPAHRPLARRAVHAYHQGVDDDVAVQDEDQDVDGSAKRRARDAPHHKREVETGVAERGSKKRVLNEEGRRESRRRHKAAATEWWIAAASSSGMNGSSSRGEPWGDEGGDTGSVQADRGNVKADKGSIKADKGCIKADKGSLKASRRREESKGGRDDDDEDEDEDDDDDFDYDDSDVKDPAWAEHGDDGLEARASEGRAGGGRTKGQKQQEKQQLQQHQQQHKRMQGAKHKVEDGADQQQPRAKRGHQADEQMNAEIGKGGHTRNEEVKVENVKGGQLRHERIKDEDEQVGDDVADSKRRRKMIESTSGRGLAEDKPTLMAGVGRQRLARDSKSSHDLSQDKSHEEESESDDDQDSFAMIRRTPKRDDRQRVLDEPDEDADDGGRRSRRGNKGSRPAEWWRFS